RLAFPNEDAICDFAVALAGSAKQRRCVGSRSFDCWSPWAQILAASAQQTSRWVTSVAIDGERGIVASGSFDGTFRLWSLASGELIAVLLSLRGGWITATADGYCDASSENLVTEVNHEI